MKCRVAAHMVKRLRKCAKCSAKIMHAFPYIEVMRVSSSLTPTVTSCL